MFPDFVWKSQLRYKVFWKWLCSLLVLGDQLHAAMFRMRVVAVYALGARLEEVSADTLGRTLGQHVARLELAVCTVFKTLTNLQRTSCSLSSESTLGGDPRAQKIMFSLVEKKGAGTPPKPGFRTPVV